MTTDERLLVALYIFGQTGQIIEVDPDQTAVWNNLTRVCAICHSAVTKIVSGSQMYMSKI